MSYSCNTKGTRAAARTVSSQTNNLDFRGFDTSRFLMLRGEILGPQDFPRDLESTILSLRIGLRPFLYAIPLFQHYALSSYAPTCALQKGGGLSGVSGLRAPPPYPSCSRMRQADHIPGLWYDMVS